MRQCLPVLLSAKFKFKEEEFIKSVESCVGLSFRYSTVSNLHNNKLEGLYSKIANSIRKQEYKTNSKVREQLKSLDPNKNIYDESFKNLNYKNNKTPRYILKKINDSLDKGGEIISSENITLEHIVPESPKSEHKKYFKENNIIHKEAVYKLYNMTILGEEYNRDASSELFENNKDIFTDKVGLGLMKGLRVKDADTLALERDLSNMLGLKVSIDFHGQGGALKIAYDTLEQLDNVLHRLTQSSES